jgi:hypothetical protein
MNQLMTKTQNSVSEYQLMQFQELIAKLFQCCQERMQYQCERFDLPDAELRCLGLFGQERYLTAKGEDSRVSLLSLTPEGQQKINEINDFLKLIHAQVLSQMAPDQRQAMLTNLDILKASMEAVKEMMV